VEASWFEWIGALHIVVLILSLLMFLVIYQVPITEFSTKRESTLQTTDWMALTPSGKTEFFIL
jgi:hypothetical protein